MASLLLSDAIDRFLEDREGEGKSRNTLKNDSGVLRQFLARTGNIQVGNITPRHCKDFFNNGTTARGKKWAPGTWNLYRATMNVFFSWCALYGHISKDPAKDPMRGVNDRDKPQPAKALVPQGRWDELLGLAKCPRDRMVFAFGLYLFTRISETVPIRWMDVDFDAKTVDIYRDKTEVADTLPMCQELEAELRRWRLAYGELTGEVPRPEWYVVPAFTTPVFAGLGEDGKTLRREQTIIPTQMFGFTGAHNAIKGALETMGLWKPREGSHTLRRSGASAWYHYLSDVKGHDRAIRMCQAMLGHKQITTTEIYLRLDVDRKTRNDLLAGRQMFESETGTVITADFQHGTTRI